MNCSGIIESGESEKVLLLMKSGVRIPFYVHFCSDKSTTPSGFNLKLRKHIHNKRLEDVHMLRYDRVLFQFCFLLDKHFMPLDMYCCLLAI
jgi:predicted ribosome quality control (RQC) complex YloA/Tae2 family protein